MTVRVLAAGSRRRGGGSGSDSGGGHSEREFGVESPRQRAKQFRPIGIGRPGGERWKPLQAGSPRSLSVAAGSRRAELVTSASQRGLSRPTAAVAGLEDAAGGHGQDLHDR